MASLVGTLAASALASAGGARAAGSSGQAQALEPILVTAGEPRGGDVALEDHVGTHTRIEGETLQRRDLTLDEVMAREAGVQRRASGGLGSFASITVRAASAAQTSILLDGVRLNSAGSPVVDLSTLDLLALDAIDIYRGVTPLQFGQDAIGGAVNLLTPRAADAPPLTRIGLGFASFGSRRAELAHRGRHGRDGRWETVATVALEASDNTYPLVNDNGTSLNPDDDRDERRRNAAAQRGSLLAKLGRRHGESARSDLLVQLAERRLEVPDWRNSPGNSAGFDTGTRQLQLTHARQGVGAWDGAHTAFLHERDDRFDDRDGEIGLGFQDTLTRTRSVGLDTFWSRPLGVGTFDAKAELRRDTLAATDRLSSGRNLDARRDELLLSARWAGYDLDGRLVVTPALRWRTSTDEVRAEEPRLAGRTRRRTNEVLSPELGLRFDASDALSLHASVGRHNREPSFDELFVDRGLVRGNPALIAERGVNADLGVRWSRGEAFELVATLFASERDELIATVFDARGVGRAINAGRARVRGLELAAAWAPAAAWRLDANATWQDAHAVSDNPALDGRQIPGEAALQLHASIAWRPSARWRLRLEADATRDRFYDAVNLLRAADATTANVGVEHRRGAWRTELAVDNLGDVAVEDFNGFPRPGRAVSVHVTFTL